MNIFEQYIFEELTQQYAESNLSLEDYEELYQRFSNIDDLPEVKPYLLAMRFWGLGTVAEKDAVLNELKNELQKNDCMLNGLYYDLLLSQEENDEENSSCLRDMEKKGYTNIFTKEKSFLGKINPAKADKTKDNSITIKINNGYMFNWIDPSSSEITLSNPYILFTDQIIASITDILSILNSIVHTNLPLLIIAKNINESVLEILKVNCCQKRLISVCVKVESENDDELFHVLNDAAMRCHGTVISEVNKIVFPYETVDILGRATSIIINENTTSIIVNAEL